MSKSRVYELLAIGTSKKSVEDTRAGNRARVAKHRANKAADGQFRYSNGNSEPDAQGALKETGEIEAPCIASEQTPEPSNHRRSVAPGDEAQRHFTAQIMELDRITKNRPPERFFGTGAPNEVLLRVAKFATDVANLKMLGADVTVPPRDEATSADEQSGENMKTERPAQDAEELRR